MKPSISLFGLAGREALASVAGRAPLARTCVEAPGTGVDDTGSHPRLGAPELRRPRPIVTEQRRGRRMARTCAGAVGLAAAVLTVAVSPSAGAQSMSASSAISTVTTNSTRLLFTGTAANNRVTFSVSGGAIVVDDQVPLQAQAGCTPVPGDATRVTCVAFTKTVTGVLQQVQVSLGDGDDVVNNATGISTSNRGAPMLVNGGSGNDHLVGNLLINDEMHGQSGHDLLFGRGGLDTLNGADGNDRLDGGDGVDRLRGGSGSDRLDGGGDDDSLDGGVGADHIDGGVPFGPGNRNNAVLYTDRIAPVTVDLRRTDASQGEANERDTIVDVQNVLTGSGNDTVTGNDHANLLIGNGGDDSLSGQEGLDVLDGGAEDDMLFPSPAGFGLLLLSDGQRDILNCGDGADLAWNILADGDVVHPDCETPINQ